MKADSKAVNKEVHRIDQAIADLRNMMGTFDNKFNDLNG